MLTVRVPASTANLGPAFDCLGLALDLWNETSFENAGEGVSVEVNGEGSDALANDETNLMARAFIDFFAHAGEAAPKGIRIVAKQRIPLGGGLGSSAAALLTGMLAANAMLSKPRKPAEVLAAAAKIEGHADNLAASLYGGLVLVTEEGNAFDVKKLECAPVQAVVITPALPLSTKDSRKALPTDVSLKDAVFNIGRSLRVAEALRSGDIAELNAAMHDRLHQPHRLALIPGAAEAVAAAQQAGAAAALSGAGPSLIAFVEPGREKPVAEAMRAPFGERGIKTELYLLNSTSAGATVEQN
jgi:homoserine kinase